jgi:hypothetical protein
VKKFFSRAGATSQELWPPPPKKFIFAASDKGFHTKDVIHKKGGQNFRCANLYALRKSLRALRALVLHHGRNRQ